MNDGVRPCVGLRRTLWWAVVAVLLASCSGPGRQAPVGVTPSAGPASAVAGPPTVDCTASNQACPEIAIAGDGPATFRGDLSPARGFADPAVRRDPAGGDLWMAYSWPHVQPVPGSTASNPTVVAVDSHLARSSDGGKTWAFVGPMWTSRAETGDAGELGWRNQEVVALAATETPGGTVWFSARDSYFTRPVDGVKLTSWTIRVATASSPTGLGAAPEGVLGFDLTAPYWRADLNLDSLSTDLAGCIFRDPGIFYTGGKLYLAAECSLFGPAGERVQDEFVGLFSTVPSGPASTWRWTYAGKLATAADARALGGDMLNQTELTTVRDGSLAAIFSPSKPSTPLETHLGCVVVKLESLDPPRLARDAAGGPQVLARATASDQAPYGPGACSYEPASATGLVIVRRLVRPQLIVSLNATGLRP